jgi:ubiquinone/menaquinone biosynthesis C-methylase UbiE
MNQDGFLNPSQIIKSLPIRGDMVVCDFGCGSGGWVVPVSRMLSSGTVYAIDILEDAISALNGKISAEGLFNITTMLSDVEKGVKIKDDFLDLVFMTNLLFQVNDKKFVLEEGKRTLKQGGIILVIDWDKDAPVGPKQSGVSIEETKALAEEIGLKPEKEFKAGNFHWGLILRKI